MITIPLEGVPYPEAARAIAQINPPRWGKGNYLDKKNLTLFVKLGDTYIGYAIAKSDYFQPTEARLSFIAVMASFKKQTAGTKLLEEIIRKVRLAGYARLHLSCRESVSPFYEKFCERHNLKMVKQQDSYWLDGEKKYHIIFELIPQR